MQGKVFFKDGSSKDYMVNIHILKSALHFIEPDTDNIKEAKSKDLLLVNVDVGRKNEHANYDEEDLSQQYVLPVVG